VSVIVILLSAGLAGAARGRFLISPRDLFAPNDEVGRSLAFFDQHFGGADLLQISVKGDFDRPGDCARLMRLTDLLEGSPLFADVRSLSQVMGMLGEQFGGIHRIPPAPEALENLWFFLEGNQDLRMLILPHRREAMIAARIAPDTHLRPAEWADVARHAAEASAATGRDGARRRLAALGDRYGLELDEARLEAVLQAAEADLAPEVARRFEETVVRDLNEFMMSPDSPFEPTRKEWEKLGAALSGPPAGRVARLERVIPTLDGFRAMEYPPEVATELAETLAEKQDARFLDLRTQALVDRLLGGAHGPGASQPFAARARGIFTDLLDPASPTTDRVEVTVSGFPAVVPLVEKRLLRGNWWAAFLLWAAMLLLSLAITRRPPDVGRAALESALATILTFGFGALFRIHLDSACATLYLLPPLAGFLNSPWLFAGRGGGPERTRVPSALALALAAASLALLITDVMPVVRIGAVMAIGLSLVAGIATISARVRGPGGRATSTAR